MDGGTGPTGAPRLRKARAAPAASSESGLIRGRALILDLARTTGTARRWLPGRCRPGTSGPRGRCAWLWLTVLAHKLGRAVGSSRRRRPGSGHRRNVAPQGVHHALVTRAQRPTRASQIIGELAVGGRDHHRAHLDLGDPAALVNNTPAPTTGAPASRQLPHAPSRKLREGVRHRDADPPRKINCGSGLRTAARSNCPSWRPRPQRWRPGPESRLTRST